jgi:hypothetical protein
MALLETLMIEVGTSIAKSILKAWLKDSDIALNASSSIIDALKSWTTDRIAQRKAEQQLLAIGEKVGESLLPIFETEGAHLDEGSRTAIALAVAETLNTASSSVLAQHDLAPSALARYLLAHPSGTQDFSETEKFLYQRIISESCEYIVDIASQLPAFTERTFAEVLKRENQLLDITRQTLEEVHRLREQADPLTEAAQFELEYRRAVIRKLDTLQLFGVDVSAASRRHRLSVAYVTLSVEQKSSPGIIPQVDMQSAVPSDLAKREDEVSRGIVSVEVALANSPRLFIRGMAGSGKTTLLQWIAVKAASQSFEGALAKWNKMLPFYVSLRYYVELGLPGPEDFPKFIAPAIADTTPKKWIRSVLGSGRAIVLVDGLDEVPTLQRDDILTWLQDLVGTYPKASFLITSRPGAISDDWTVWTDREGFNDGELQPMELSDIHAFIDHWHAAVAEGLHDEQEKAELPSFAQHLKEEVENSRPIRTLATSPLLCAMLCALNRERQEQLPSDRIKLYEACCEMLIERRDRERRISLSDYPAATLLYREKIVLLADLAYWLIHNGWSQIELQRAEERFARKLTDMHNIAQNVSSIDVCRLFVERTSILREPIAGHIDFTHRTFQEFLAAKAALDEGDIGVLVKNAHDDQWREVIILASGLATRKVREELIQELLKRGDTEKEHRYQLHLLAVSCLATSVELGQEVKVEVSKRLSALVPPKNITEARALAASGELGVPYLVKSKQYPATTTAACIRALSLIGGDAAFKAIEGYAQDTRSTVVDELMKAWASFDRKEYARRILAQTFQRKPDLRLEHLSSLDGLQYLTNLTTLDLSDCGQVSDLSPLATLTQLTALDLSSCEQVSDLSPLGKLTQLAWLHLSGCKQVSNLSPLGKLTQLTDLDLSGCKQVSDLSPLGKLTRLTGLDLRGCEQVNDLSPLATLTQMAALDLSSCGQVSDLSPLATLTQLSSLSLSGCGRVSDLSPLATLTRLSQLDLSHCVGVSDLSPLKELKYLTAIRNDTTL